MAPGIFTWVDVIIDDRTGMLLASTTRVLLPSWPSNIDGGQARGRGGVVDDERVVTVRALERQRGLVRELERLEVVDGDQPGAVAVIRRGGIAAVGSLLVVDRVVRRECRRRSSGAGTLS